MDEFTSAGVRIAYIDEAPVGEHRNEPILLIHGFASTHAVNWVFPHWVKVLTQAGRRVIAFDNRGHGRSDKLYDPADYHLPVLAADARALLDHLAIERADVMGYSLGARISAFLALAAPGRTRSIVLGGLGSHLVDGAALPQNIAEAMEAPSLDVLTDPTQRMFRQFADAAKNDRKALAACIRGSRQLLSEAEVGRIMVPALVAVGTKDQIAGDPHRLAAMFPAARAVDIPGRDHNLAVGDKIYKQSVLEFLEQRP
jgi:pimeloyl-ACP methyl ester carboxylesterase